MFLTVYIKSLCQHKLKLSETFIWNWNFQIETFQIKTFINAWATWLGEGLYHNTYPPGKNGEGIVETTAKTGNVTGGIAKLAIVSKGNSIYSEIQILF